MLFRRRPDLKCLELTCENTFTVLPYIDLANEVMESFVVHLGDYATDTHDPKQATLDVFNVGDETTSELLAQPQHVNYQAYCILKNAVYPFTLPYHQPIDVARIWLPALGTSRYELLDTFRTATETCPSANLTPAQQAQLDTLHAHVYDRAVDAEFLRITQEEYIILTREAFWEKPYFELTTAQTFTDDDYRAHIGVKNVWQYYGYTDDTQMLDTDEAGQHLGLTFVAEQFLPRTGIHYTDLVDIVRTRFINPNLPTGHALTLMDAIAFSYRFLQSLLDPSDSNGKYAKLIAFLNTTQPLIPWIDAILHPDPCHRLDPCHTESPCGCGTPEDFTNWVECYFERIGQLIVLDAGEGPLLPVTGTVKYVDGELEQTLGTLTADGLIKDANGSVVARVIANFDATARAVGPDFGPLKPPLVPAEVVDADNHDVAWIDRDGTMTTPCPQTAAAVAVIRDLPLCQIVEWSSAQELCDLNTVRLTHLDGSALTDAEYDRIQRFIRLWRKLGWTISETDQALVALSAKPARRRNGRRHVRIRRIRHLPGQLHPDHNRRRLRHRRRWRRQRWQRLPGHPPCTRRHLPGDDPSTGRHRASARHHRARAGQSAGAVGRHRHQRGPPAVCAAVLDPQRAGHRQRVSLRRQRQLPDRQHQTVRPPSRRAGRAEAEGRRAGRHRRRPAPARRPHRAHPDRAVPLRALRESPACAGHRAARHLRPARGPLHRPADDPRTS